MGDTGASTQTCKAVCINGFDMFDGKDAKEFMNAILEDF
jgi:hypothetical protein